MAKRNVHVISEDDEYVTVRIKRHKASADTIISHIEALPAATGYVVDGATWISPSRLRNYLLGDPILDWLERHGSAVSERACFPQDGQADFMSYLRERGTAFEQRVWQNVQQRFADHCRQVCNTVHDISLESKYLETRALMVQKVPIIYQACLHDAELKRYGSPDFLVLRSWMSRLVPMWRDPDELLCRETSVKDHYVVVDVKYMTLPLRAEGTRLLNTGSLHHYKAQLIFYTDMLNKMQTTQSHYCYLLGRGHAYVTCGERYRSDTCFDRLGVIDCDGLDMPYRQRIADAIAWTQRLRVHGASWNVLPKPSVPELYPNMANGKDYPHHSLKEYIAKELKDITLLWGCGAKHRALAFKRRIYKYDDPRLTAAKLGFRGPVQSRIVEAMLRHQRQNRCVVTPRHIEDNRNDWQTSALDFYVDFETVSSAFDDLEQFPRIGGNNAIFMIGVGYVVDGKWHYRNFTADRATPECEAEILDKFLLYMQQVCDERGGDYVPNVYHWSQAEPSHFKRALETHADLTVYSDFNFVDMLGVFKDATVLIKDVLNFSLKSVAKGLAKHGLIPAMYSGSVTDGGDAMFRAYSCYKTAALQKKRVTSLIQFKHITSYNEIDCKVIWEIVKYLRTNHARKA